MTSSDAEKHMRNAGIAAIVSASATLIFSLLALAGSPRGGYDVWNLTDAAFIYGLAFGIFKKSRTCVTLMLIYVICDKALSISEGRVVFALLIGGIFAYFYFQGVRGAFAWHRQKKALARMSEPPELSDPGTT